MRSRSDRGRSAPSGPDPLMDSPARKLLGRGLEDDPLASLLDRALGSEGIPELEPLADRHVGDQIREHGGHDLAAHVHAVPRIDSLIAQRFDEADVAAEQIGL